MPSTSVKVTHTKRLNIYLRDGWICHLCKGPVDPDLRGKNSRRAPSLDHIIPRSEGGSNHYENLALAHRSCNSRRMSLALDKLDVVLVN
jgi:5-methylcytosine-specific restriction endonuclease McrA